MKKLSDTVVRTLVLAGICLFLTACSSKEEEEGAVKEGPLEKAEVIEAPLDSSVVVDAMKGKTVRLSGGTLSPVADGINPDAKYIAIYYSAHWCPPCRKFTPMLSQFYSKYSALYDNFELVFVSSDQGEKEMEEYMKWGNMSFPALAYGEVRSTPQITKYAGSGIPHLVVVDRAGKVLADSVNNGNYVGPVVPLEKLKQLIAADG